MMAVNASHSYTVNVKYQDAAEKSIAIVIVTGSSATGCVDTVSPNNAHQG